MYSLLAFGVLGLIVGSFLNVFILRHGVRSLGGRSACMSCGAKIFWYDNIPVLSWFLLHGRCRACGAHISLQYPLVEASTAALFALVGGAAASLPFDQPLLFFALIPTLAVIAILIAIFVYDLYHTIIPNPWVYFFIVFALLLGFWSWTFDTTPLYLFVLAGPIAALPLFALWLVSRGMWMGFGDVKLALGIGWLLGPFYGIIVIFFAFIIGAVISVGVLLPLPHILRALDSLGITSYALAGQGYTMKSEIPFGPFLICSTFVVWFLLLYGIDPLSIAPSLLWSFSW